MLFSLFTFISSVLDIRIGVPSLWLSDTMLRTSFLSRYQKRTPYIYGRFGAEGLTIRDIITVNYAIKT